MKASLPAQSAARPPLDPHRAAGDEPAVPGPLAMKKVAYYYYYYYFYYYEGPP